MSRKELLVKGVKKCYSYRDFVAEILKIPKEKNVSVNGNDVYIDGKCSIVYVGTNKVAPTDEKFSSKMHSIRIKDCIWEQIVNNANHVGCSCTEVIEYAIAMLDVRGGMKSAAEILGLDK